MGRGINKQRSKDEICQVVGKCCDEKIKQSKENSDRKGREITISHIFNI